MLPSECFCKLCLLFVVIAMLVRQKKSKIENAKIYQLKNYSSIWRQIFTILVCFLSLFT